VTIYGFFLQKEDNASSDGVLCGAIPDIAMATSSLNQLSLQERESALSRSGDLELDLGDGTPHSNSGTLYI